MFFESDGIRFDIAQNAIEVVLVPRKKWVLSSLRTIVAVLMFETRN